jgi:hypothetical protein
VQRDGLTQIVLSSVDLTLTGPPSVFTPFLSEHPYGYYGRAHRRVPEGAQIERPRAERNEGQAPPGILTVVVI